MTLFRFSFLLCAVLFIHSCSPEAIPPTEICPVEGMLPLTEDHPKSDEVRALMDEYISKGLPGMTVLISDDNGIWYGSAGFADIENNVAMQPCHINKLGSVTKMMVGALVWQLVQDEVLSLDDPISQYIPEVASKIANGNDITLKMLINHTSGVYDIAGDLGYNLAVVNDFSRSWTSEEILSFLEGKPATGLPGEEVRYSNSNTMLVGMVIDAATGEHHGELLKTRIFDVLGMNNTIYYNYDEDFPSPYLAQGYLDFNNDGGDIQNISNLNPGSGNGYTGVYSTVMDLHTFLNALLREKTLTTPENIERIYESMQWADSGTWKSSIGGIHDQQRHILPEDQHAYGHDGGDIGYSANLSYLPHNNTIFAATYNYGSNLPTNLSDIMNEVREKLYVLSAE